MHVCLVHVGLVLVIYLSLLVFSALILLVGHYEQHLTCKKMSDEVLS